MPELPEVETIRRGLQTRILNIPIKKIEIRKQKLIRGSVDLFAKTLTKKSFDYIDRRGKLLALHIADTNQYVLVHLKMTGQLIYKQGQTLVVGGHSWPQVGELPNKYSHIIFWFADGSALFFNDQRQFGYMHIVDQAEKDRIWQTFGLEPLTQDFTWPKFKQIITKRAGRIKAVLLNQQIFAGIGNIYADEICFRAKLKPDRMFSSLTPQEQKDLYLSCKQVMTQAVKYRGTTFSDYRDSDGKSGGFARLLKVYGRNKKACLRCKQAVILKKTIAGRGTHFCANCQK